MPKPAQSGSWILVQRVPANFMSEEFLVKIRFCKKKTMPFPANIENDWPSHEFIRDNEEGRWRVNGSIRGGCEILFHDLQNNKSIRVGKNSILIFLSRTCIRLL